MDLEEADWELSKEEATVDWMLLLEVEPVVNYATELQETAAIHALKQLSTRLPWLQIPSDGRRILQTDASDTHWGAVLLEENPDSTRTVCGYKSGSFKTSEAHYHSTFKEILAVRRGIEKFQFHLIGHRFLIELDMSSFP
ncbi:uncharacterized protein LOC122082100 [Macadamia integrifolia]|uniref:uncharacterized protein LOC122082100 n=1 Tax=Macadamia integrifolia TaxID=60698 RepID=UPI001C4E9022|nr:uncharacterized protein LOC122082100 [Macadamia integrifolia]